MSTEKIILCGFADEADPMLDGQIEALKANGISLLEIRGVDGKSIVDVTVEEAKEIKAKLDEKRRNSQPLDLPSCGSAFKRPVGGYAAALIEEAGLKGYSVGGAQVSEKHSGFVVNKGGATYDDIVALMDHIRKEVKKNSGITLEPEMKIYPKKMILVDQTPVEIPEELKEEFEKFKQERAKQKKDEEN